MKPEKLFFLILTAALCFIFSFLLFSYFKTEGKPIYTPIYGEINIKNNWLFLFFSIVSYLLLFKLLTNKRVNLKIIFILGFFLIILVNSIKTGLAFFSPLVNPNNFYTDALRINNIFQFVKKFDGKIYYYQLHTRTHPPGPVVFHFILNKLFNNQIIINSLIMVFISTLTLFVLYKIAEILKNSNKNYLLLLLFSSPGFLLYSATCMDSVFAFLIASSIYRLLLLYSKPSAKNIILTAIIAFLASFFTYAAVIIFFFGIFFSFFNKFKNKKYFINQVKTYLLILAIYLLLYLVNGYKPILSFIEARRFNTMLMPNIFMTAKRYVYSVTANFTEYIIFLGLPIFSIFIYNLISLIKKRKTNLRLNYYLSILIPIIVLNLLGIYKTGLWSGETGRIWLFLTPLIIAGLKIENKRLAKIAAISSFIQTLFIQLSLNIFW